LIGGNGRGSAYNGIGGTQFVGGTLGGAFGKGGTAANGAAICNGNNVG
jgi:hypothetical protein